MVNNHETLVYERKNGVLRYYGMNIGQDVRFIAVW